MSKVNIEVSGDVGCGKSIIMFEIGELLFRKFGVDVKSPQLHEEMSANNLSSPEDWQLKSIRDTEWSMTEVTQKPEALNKPKRTKVEYERVDFVDHWEYFKLMSEEGDLYVSCVDLAYEGLYGDNINLANALQDGSCIYRRIETEIDERQEFIETYAWAVQDDKENIEDIAGMLYDSGKFKLVEGE